LAGLFPEHSPGTKRDLPVLLPQDQSDVTSTVNKETPLQ